MKFKIVIIVVAAAVLSFAAAGSAAAQPLGPANAYRPASSQVNGTRLAAALLPPSAFGDGFAFQDSLNTGSELLSTHASKHVQSLSCAAFESKEYVAFFGNTAGAALGYTNPGWQSSFPDTIIGGDEDVQQFATSAAATTYYNQVWAKFAACRYFTETLSGYVFDVDVVSLTKTTVGGNRAFVVIQTAALGIAPALSRYLACLYVVVGQDVYHLDQGSGVNDQPSSTLMLRLIHRVQAL